MGIKKRMNISVGRKYTDSQGAEKTAWTSIGKLFVSDENKVSIKLNVIPIGWDGFAGVFEEQSQTQQAAPPAAYPPPAQQPPLHQGAPPPYGSGYQPPQQQAPPAYIPPEDDLPF